MTVGKQKKEGASRPDIAYTGESSRKKRKARKKPAAPSAARKKRKRKEKPHASPQMHL